MAKADESDYERYKRMEYHLSENYYYVWDTEWPMTGWTPPYLGAPAHSGPHLSPNVPMRTCPDCKRDVAAQYEDCPLCWLDRINDQGIESNRRTVEERDGWTSCIACGFKVRLTKHQFRVCARCGTRQDETESAPRR
jgi:RNA polymerase subunit RPABC4/transcription elongation factor Spt4